MSRTCPTCRGLGVVPDVAELPTDEALRAAADDDAPTIQLPPIRDTVRRRPPVPEVRRLEDRAELLAALVHELQGELVELRGGDEDDEDATCGAVVIDVGGRSWICSEPKGHPGEHAHRLAPR